MFSCHNLYLFHTLTDRLVLLFANIDLKKKEYYITSHVATYLFSHVCVCVCVCVCIGWCMSPISISIMTLFDFN